MCGLTILKYSFFLKIYLFIEDCIESLLLCGLSLLEARRGYSLVAVHGLLHALASVVAENRFQTYRLQ